MSRSVAWLFALLTLTVPAQASDARVVLGEVSSQVVRTGVDYQAIVRLVPEAELSHLDLRPIPDGRRVIVSVSLVRLDTKAASAGADATCRVSATLRNAKSGAIFATLEGQARATGGGARAAAEASAVLGALHGMLARVPDALRR